MSDKPDDPMMSAFIEWAKTQGITINLIDCTPKKSAETPIVKKSLTVEKLLNKGSKS
jgi:hypothetical protein